jgi:hypothetical protein
MHPQSAVLTMMLSGATKTLTEKPTQIHPSMTTRLSPLLSKKNALITLEEEKGEEEGDTKDADIEEENDLGREHLGFLGCID